MGSAIYNYFTLLFAIGSDYFEFKRLFKFMANFFKNVIKIVEREF
jgi:hypothetical protein